MNRAHPPELKKYMDKKMSVKLNGNRRVKGIMRGFDPFMNIVLENAVEIDKDNQEINIGSIVIRGNSINILEAVDRVF